MMNISSLLSFLNGIGISPKKSLSQNFLIDANVVRKIVEMADVQPGDTVLEIGPGPGALTSLLLEKGAHVIAIEKDFVLAKALQRLQTEDGRLTVYAEDALEFPLETLQFSKVVANLPYHITTPLLEKLFATSFHSLTVMVQKEFADRIFAKTNFSSLAIFTRVYTTPVSRFTVSPHSFFPKPSIESSVMHLHSHPRIPIPDSFFPVLHKAFQNRRKCISTSLKPLFPQDKIKEALRDSSLREDARPETLALNDWLIFLKNLKAAIVQENGCLRLS